MGLLPHSAGCGYADTAEPWTEVCCTGNMEELHWGNPDDKLKIHQALTFGRPIIYVMLSNLSDCLLKLIMKVF